MNDTRTTELESLSKLKMAGRLRYWRGTIEIPETELHAICDEIQAEHDRAIAAMPGSEPPYDELLRCLENDWNIRASWDGLRRFWCIELTEEGVRLRDAELNSRAEQTCNLIEDGDLLHCSNICISEIEREIAEKYMELPVDADGVPIHIGDNLHSDETKRSFPCRGYSLTLNGNLKWWTVECCYDSYSGTSEYVSAKSCHHVNQRTVEDVLRDYWREACELPVDMSDESTAEAIDKLVVKYRAEICELRLMGVDE